MLVIFIESIIVDHINAKAHRLFTQTSHSNVSLDYYFQVGYHSFITSAYEIDMIRFFHPPSKDTLSK